MIVTCKYCDQQYDDVKNNYVCPYCTAGLTHEKARENEIHKMNMDFTKKVQDFEIVNITKREQRIKLFGLLAIILLIFAFIVYQINKPIGGFSKTERDQLVKTGEKYYLSGEYENAISTLEQVPVESKQYIKASELLVKCKEEYIEGILKKANEYIEKEEYEPAINLMKHAMNYVDDNSTLNSLLKSTNTTYINKLIEDTVKTSEEYYDKDDYVSAINIINDAIAKVGVNSELNSYLSKYNDGYVNKTINDAKAKFKEYDAESINEALHIISESLKVLENNPTLTKEYQFYESKLPEVVWNAYGNYVEDIVQNSAGEYTSINGTRYTNLYRLRESYYWLMFDPYQLVIPTEYKYTQLTGVLIRDEAIKESEVEITYDIYGKTLGSDDSIKLLSGVLSKNNDIVDFSINVKQYNKIIIRGRSNVGLKDGDYTDYLMVGNLFLWP